MPQKREEPTKTPKMPMQAKIAEVRRYPNSGVGEELTTAPVTMGTRN
jgi:hypothetical protein